MRKRDSKTLPSGAVVHIVAAAAAMAAVGSAHAIELQTGNPDLRVRADATLRYNLGVRTESQDPRLLKFATTDEGNAKFDRGDVVTNRVDVLGELDVNYKGQLGVRMSAASWYDHAYRNRSVTSPAGSPTSYFNDRYSDEVTRFVRGPSGEILDAFVWSNFNLGQAPVNVKLGKHTVVWGEGLLIGGHAISYSQSPIDGVKAVSSPGIETKEVFLPINQLTFKAQVTDKLSIAGQYALDWEPTRVPHAGTFLMGADNAPTVDRFALTPFNPALGPLSGRTMTKTAAKEPGKTGNWGLSARMDLDAIDSTVGLYYRKFNDYNPETGIQLANFFQVVPGVAATTLPGTFRFVYPQNTKVIGASISKPVGPVSVGADVSWRKDAHLNSAPSYTATSTGAKGDTFHAVVNGVYLLPKTGLWDTGSLIGELAYSRLNKVTANANLFRGVGSPACVKLGTGSGGVPAQPGDITDTCSTKNYWEVAVRFTPQYLAIFPSWDLSIPMAINYGLKGTAATGGGGFEGRLSWSVGLGATYANAHEFTLTYADLAVPTKYNAAGTVAIGGNALNSAVGATDRGRLLFTYKTSF